MISFDTVANDMRLIHSIVYRFKNRTLAANKSIDLMSVAMDITAVHANGCPLRLKELLDANDFNFIHDVGGIIRHLDRDTGKLQGHFRPRFAA